MPLTINSPVAALRNMRALRDTQGTLSDSMRRIASGVRVDTAADDPGRLGSTLLAESKLRGLRQSIRNLNDGLSLTQTLEGGLSQITSALQRLRELSVQAANETYNYADRLALQAEADQMIGLIDKAVEQTQFNGIKLLDGSARNLDIFVDQPSGEVETLSLGLLKVDTTEMSRRAFYESERRGVYLGTLANGDLKINGVAIRGTVASDDESSLSYQAGSAIAKAKAINSAAHLTGVRARARANVITANRAIGPYTLDGQNFFAINGHQFSGFKIEDFDADGKLRDAINSAHSETGVKAQLDNQGQLQLIAEDGRNIQIKYSNMLTMLSIGLADTSGDETNLKGIVEKSSIETGNPASHASFVPSGSPTSADYFGTIMNFQTTHDLSNFTGSIDVGGSFDPGVENIDYVVQFVEGGALGTAKFRILSETASETNAAETAEAGSGPDGEDFSFLVTTPDPVSDVDTSNVSSYLSAVSGGITNTGSVTTAPDVILAGTYNEGPDRVYTLKVVDSGSTDSADPSQRARIEVTTDVDGATVIAAFTVQSGVAHNIGSNVNQTGENLTVTFGDTLRGQSVSQSLVGSQAQEYNLTLTQGAGATDLRVVGDFDTFTKDISMTKTIEVVETGYTSQAGNLAKLRVVSTWTDDDGAHVVTIPTFSISADTNIDIGDGLSIFFPDLDPVLEFAQNAVVPRDSGGTGSYEAGQDVTLVSDPEDFVGERGNGTYSLEILKGGKTDTATYQTVFTRDSDGSRTILTAEATLPDGDVDLGDGLTLNFDASTPSIGATTTTGSVVAGDSHGDYSTSAFSFSGNYLGDYHDTSVSVTVVKEGRVLAGGETETADGALLRYEITPGTGINATILPVLSGTFTAQTGSVNLAQGVVFDIGAASGLTALTDNNLDLGYAGSIALSFDESAFEYGEDLSIRVTENGSLQIPTGALPAGSGGLTVQLVDEANNVEFTKVFSAASLSSGSSAEIVKGLEITFTNDFTAVSFSGVAGNNDSASLSVAGGASYNNALGDKSYQLSFVNDTSTSLTGPGGSLVAGQNVYSGNYGDKVIDIQFTGSEIVPSGALAGSAINFDAAYNGSMGDTSFDVEFLASSASISAPASPTTGSFALTGASGYQGLAGTETLSFTFEGKTDVSTASTVSAYGITVDATGFNWNDGSNQTLVATVTDEAIDEVNLTTSGGISLGTFTASTIISAGVFQGVQLTIDDVNLDTTGDEFTYTFTPQQSVTVSDGSNSVTGVDISGGPIDLGAASFSSLGTLTGLTVNFSAATAATADTYNLKLRPDRVILTAVNSSGEIEITNSSNSDVTLDLDTYKSIFGVGSQDPGFDLIISNPNDAVDENVTYNLNTKTEVELSVGGAGTITADVSSGTLDLDAFTPAELAGLLGSSNHPTDTSTGVDVSFTNVNNRVNDSYTLTLGKTPKLSVQELNVTTGAPVGAATEHTITDGNLNLTALLGADPGFNIALSDAIKGFDDVYQLDLTSSDVNAGGEVVGSLNVQSLSFGESFQAALTADVLNAGESYSVHATSPVLRAGSSYTVQEHVNRLEENDTITIDVDSAFEPTIYTAQASTPITNGLTLDFNGTGTFEVGDEFRFQASGYRGGFSVFGQYTDPAYPTTIEVEVITEGDVDGGAVLRARRQDGGAINDAFDEADPNALFVDFNAVTTAQTLTVGGDGYIGKGVFIQFDQNPGADESHRLYKGDKFYLDVIGSLSQNFAAGISLESDNNIMLEYSETNVDNKLGRLLYVGDEDAANNPGTIGSLSKAVLAVNTEFSIAKIDLMSQEGAEDAMLMVDHAIGRIDESRSKMGAMQNRMSSEINTLSEAAFQTERYGSRIKDADIAAEVAELTSAQIRQQAGIGILQQINQSGSLSLILVESLLG